MLANYLLKSSGLSQTKGQIEEIQRAAKRELARRSLIEFTRWTYPRYKADAAHWLLAEHLEKIISGEIRKLMVFAPPQHGKSELVSVRLPAFWLGKRPDDPVILSSYAASLAERHSSEARGTVESDAYHELFPDIGTRNDSRSKQYWRIADHKGGMLAVGVGGPVTGNGGLLGIIDDPFENWKQAQSPTVRNHVWNWWKATFRTRIWKNGAIILVMTRWHEDDLAGKLLSDQGDQWTVLRLPALAESQEERDKCNEDLGLPIGLPDPLGRNAQEPLCPARFDYQALVELKRDVGNLAWQAEYQGTPKDPEGNIFKREWFQIVNEVPRNARRIRYWDKAGTKDGGDYTVGVLMAEHDGRYFIEDVVRGQWSAYERDLIILQTAKSDGVEVEIWIEQEGGSGGKDSADATKKKLAGFTIHADHPTGDKIVRANPYAAQCEALNVFIKRGPWNAAYIDELCAFPNGANDDQVDGSSGSFNKLSNASGWSEYIKRKLKESQERNNEQ